MRILVVDDQPLIAEDIQDELQKLLPNADCARTSDPQEVLRLCETQQYDVICMDIDMPGMNGLTLAKKILDQHPYTNIIYITGYDKYALDSYRTYASAFLVKPVNTERLREVFSHLRHPVSSITEEMIRDNYSGNAALGARIRMFREKRGLSRNEFAKQMNVSVQSVYRWESGERVPDILTLLEIARVLCATMDQLTGTASADK